MVFLQLALDLIEFKKALDIAELAYPYVDIIEAGTPLIKSEGIRVVSELKRRFKDKLVFADLKTMDTGALEAQLAFRAGADIVSVCAQASKDTIRAAVEESRKWGRRITIDLIGVEDVVLKARELVCFSPDYFCVHTGVDEQVSGKRGFDKVKRFHMEVSYPYAVAGGIRPEDIAPLMDFKPSIVVVGGYVTGASEPDRATRVIREELDRFTRYHF